MDMARLKLSDQRELHYARIGDTGSPVVLLHGYLDSHLSFYRLFEALGAKHRLYLPDQRGHGDSDPAADYGIAGFTGDAIAFIEGLDVGPVHLGGHSLGGIVAQRVAALRPDLIRSLALISTSRHAGNSQALLETVPLLAKLADPVPESLVQEFQGSTTFAPLPEAIFAPYLAETRKVSADVWRRALDGLVEEPPLPAALPSDIPALVLWGKDDGLFLKPDQDALRGHFTRANFVEYAETGHAPNWERPAEVAMALLNFWHGLDREEISS
jgi:pimeloyl-ACP methyl ester carboxylesterase